MKQALPPLSARSLWANSRAAFPVHLTGAFRCGFHMDAMRVYQALSNILGKWAFPSRRTCGDILAIASEQKETSHEYRSKNKA